MSIQTLQRAFSVEPPSPQRIIESLQHPVLVINERNEITYANAAAQATFGGWIVGLFINDIFSGEMNSVGSLLSADAPVSLITKTEAKFVAFVGSIGADHIVVSLYPNQTQNTVRIAEVDELTGLFKRNGLIATLDQSLSPYSSDRGRIAVHCLDLDRFKVVNDTLGHAVGDLLLKKVADRLRSACRTGDCIARIGGDEFVIVQGGVECVEDAEKLSARLVDLIGRTYVLSGHTVNIGLSIGVALYNETLLPNDIIRNADLALYEAKRAGRSRYRLFEAGMDTSLRERRDLEIELRRAVALKQFELHYQPIFQLNEDQLLGFEALIRWNHPTRGQISPLDFIALTEETGLIHRIGEWVLLTACTAAASWPEALMVAVNVSPVQFKGDAVVETITAALARSGLPAHRLEIEITEGALLDNTESVLTTLHALRKLGVKISMDDFGTGYSSLSYLQKFPFDKIKIDRSFVQNAVAGSDSESILNAIAGLGTSLGIAIVAEGVETAEQLQRIRDKHCTQVQGFLTGRPMSADSVITFVAPQTPEMRSNAR